MNTPKSSLISTFSCVVFTTLLLAAASASSFKLDLNFKPALPSSSGASINAMAAMPDGKIAVAGFFSVVNGSVHQYLARLNPDGTTDSSFDSGNAVIRGMPGIQGLIPQLDGKLIVWGSISFEDQYHFVRLDSTGAVDRTFATSRQTIDGFVVPLGFRSNNDLVAIIQPTSGGQTNRLVLLDSTGAFKAELPSGADVDPYHYFFANQPDGSFIVSS